MKKTLHIILLLFLTLITSCAKAYNSTPIYPPQHTKGEVIEHTYFTLCYQEEHEQPSWVYYHLTSQQIEGTQSRTDNFRIDPKVSTGSATLADYKDSGYDRGHLCPAGAMKLNHTAMSETFYMSNMSPQSPSFNRGIWKKLEEALREYALENGTLHVVTGPIFKDNLGVIGENEVTIPGYFYKAVYSPAEEKMYAFILPHEGSKADLSDFCVSVDYLEELVGIDFFAELDEALEAELEAKTFSF